MTTLLEKAFKEAEKLPAIEQNSVAKWLMEEIESDRKWDKSFSVSEDKLASLAKEALQEYNRGNTEELDIDKL